MAYASLADLRAEGVSESVADDARIERALAGATATIDRLCGWFFEPRDLTIRLDGRGRRSLLLPVPPIRLDVVEVNESPLPLESLRVEGAPVAAGFLEPRVVLDGGAFPRGTQNVRLTGRFGYTLPDGSAEGMTPAAIRRAALLLAMRGVPGVATDAGRDARDAWRIIEERTRDQAVKFQPDPVGALTGIAEVDRLLEPYRRPRPIGAA
jgi:hypothetical protein